MNKQLVSTSKFLSLVLRHQPDVIGIELDPEGWASIDRLIKNANARGTAISLDLLHEVVATSDKRRFALSDDGLRIRANQGHSVEGVDLKTRANRTARTVIPRHRRAIPSRHPRKGVVETISASCASVGGQRDRHKSRPTAR
ncbi:RNA 2'-phosphotransferase [Novipirellula aureliae]|uniref:RNA 2'-phosphotransferase n=1 Tax=Novipirellula aureliae TaxID=2527966 RepID=UPI0021BCD9D2|nr:RNA 2'-phosphotransferase [Novipirellula aureliae]